MYRANALHTVYLLHFAGVSHVHDFFVDELLRLRFKLEFTYRTRSFASIHCTGWHFRWLLFTSCLFFVDLLKWLFVWWIDFCSDKHLFQPNVENVHTCHQVFCSSVADYHTYLSYRSSMAQSIFLYFLVEIVRLADWGELMINTTKQTFDFCCFFIFIHIKYLLIYCVFIAFDFFEFWLCRPWFTLCLASLYRWTEDGAFCLFPDETSCQNGVLCLENWYLNVHKNYNQNQSN